MATTSANPHGLEDGMIVRSLAKPSKVFRVSGSPNRGRATFVAMSPGTQTVMNGNARNYRPETQDEYLEREGDSSQEDASADVFDTVDRSFPTTAPAENVTMSNDEFEIAELCVRMQDAVARVADGECDPDDAAAIVTAAAALNDAVVRREIAYRADR